MFIALIKIQHSADGAFGVHAEEDGDEDSEAPEGAATVAEEG